MGTVLFPETLIMQPFCTSQDSPCEYTLFATVSHIGQSIHGMAIKVGFN